MSRTRKFDAERLAELRRWHARGLNTAALADLFGEPYGTIRRILNEGYTDSPPTPGRNARPGRPSKFVGKTLRLLHRRREQGRSIRQLIEEFDAPRSVIYMALKRDPSRAEINAVVSDDPRRRVHAQSVAHVEHRQTEGLPPDAIRP